MARCSSVMMGAPGAVDMSGNSGEGIAVAVLETFTSIRLALSLVGDPTYRPYGARDDGVGVQGVIPHKL